MVRGWGGKGEGEGGLGNEERREGGERKNQMIFKKNYNNK